MPADDRPRLELARERVESGLRLIGGEQLLADARAEAEWYVAEFFVWDGRGVEPIERLPARL